MHSKGLQPSILTYRQRGFKWDLAKFCHLEGLLTLIVDQSNDAPRIAVDLLSAGELAEGLLLRPLLSCLGMALLTLSDFWGSSFPPVKKSTHMAFAASEPF